MLRENHGVQNYFPEKERLAGKHERTSRVLRERFGVFSASDGFRELISCGRRALPEGDLFSAHGIGREERIFAETELKRGGRVLLSVADGSLLVFGDWLCAVGLVLALHVPEAKETVAQTLGMMRRTDFAVSRYENAASHSAKASPDDVLDHMAEIFYYLDRILSPSAELGLLTRAALIAELIGCHADCNALPTDFPALQSEKVARLTSFLFCAFMSLRNERVSAEAEQTKGWERSFLCSLTCADEAADFSDERSKEALVRDFSWTRHPAFASFEITLQRDGISLRAEMASAFSVPRIRSEIAAKKWCLSLSLA